MHMDTAEIRRNMAGIPDDEICNYIPIPAEDLRRLENAGYTERKGWMRNQPCPCKSGKKFKRCCMLKLRKR